MNLTQPDDLHGFSSEPPPEGWEAVLVSRDGHTPVVLMHELPSITPEVMHLARVFVSDGFRV